MPTVLITGANRGLGLEFCRQFVEKDWNVIACCRDPAHADALLELNKKQSKIQIEALDVTHFNQIDALSKKIASVDIDVLINNAGVYDDNQTNGFGRLDYQAWNHSLLINTQAPVKMVEAFLPQVKRGAKRLIVNISSLMGSLTDNNSGGSILYRSSKAALNAAMKSLSLELKAQDIGILIFHPGWVQTDMGGKNALIDSNTSVSGMCSAIDKFTMIQTGSFIKYDASPLPW